ncbi:7954_t:CDS:2 [Gigaspora rosea]|nr:7954_t:CDS:2 [Gigaspora rosea]
MNNKVSTAWHSAETLREIAKNIKNQWNKENLKNEKLLQEILEELKSNESALDWDTCKINIQSITRAFKKPKRPERSLKIRLEPR